jgi:urease accessory protein
MTRHWQPAGLTTTTDGFDAAARVGRFHLAFNRHGDITQIGEQFVSYPFHFTRPFRLDADIPELLTAYQQSSSGGLYRDDRLDNRFVVTAGAAAHVTTQAASVVYACNGMPARQTTNIDVQAGGYLAYTPDPAILFPGAALNARIDLRLGPDAVVLLHDAFAWHDPAAANGAFDRLCNDVIVRDRDGRLLVRDRFAVTGEQSAASFATSRDWRVVSNSLLLGPAARLPSRELLRAVLARDDILVGISALPNDAGWSVRCVATGAVAARQASNAAFVTSVQAAFDGRTPNPRRK